MEKKKINAINIAAITAITILPIIVSYGATIPVNIFPVSVPGNWGG